VGEATAGVEALLLQSPPSAVVVQGDTNSALGGALAANAAGIPLVHLEAGLRSFDRAMPEEHNRVLIDAIADRCLVPHELNLQLLLREGVPPERIRVVGSTLRESLMPMLPSAGEADELLSVHGLEPGRYVLATVHRPENTDDEHRLRAILSELASLDIRVVLPMHPRTRERVGRYGLDHLLDGFRVVEPLGYRHFIHLAARSAMLISDSGGVQEEATIVKRPVVVMRNSTERPEILGTFAHLVPVGPAIGETARRVLADLGSVHAALEALPYPYGENVTAKCVAAIDELVAEHSS
jgi:UDP-N-acetylglucosamine 2-epimerase (non-hydrolysing)